MKKLHNVEAIILSNVQGARPALTSRDPEVFASEVSNQFSNKWGVNRLQDRMNILDTVRMHDGIWYSGDT